jgi:drug/metabolite transporter (DMT)-like permease
MRLTHRKAVWLMVLVTLMWSMAGVVTRQLRGTEGFEVTFWRSFTTFLALLVILPLVDREGRGGKVFKRIPWRSRTLWLSSFCWAAMFTAFMLALTLTTVANVLITLAIAPLCTALLARFFLHQRIAPRTWVAIVVAGAGIAWMYGSQLNWGEGRFDARGLLTAFALLLTPLAGAVQWTVLQRSQTQGEQVDMVPSVLLGAGLSALLTLPAAWPLQVFAQSLHTDLAWLVLLGVMQLAIPCVLVVYCTRVLPAPEVSLLALLEVIFGIAWAWLGAGEAPGPNVLVGGLLVIGALAGNEVLGWRERRNALGDEDHEPRPAILS